MRAVVLAVGLIASLASAAAQSPSSVTIADIKFDFNNPARAPATEQQKRFLVTYRAARSTGDQAAISALVHPASFGCRTSPIARDYFSARLAREVDATPLQNVRVIFVPVPDGHGGFVQGNPPMMTLPVTATQFFALDYKRGEHDASGGTIIRELAPDGDDLKIIVHCLTPEGERAFAKKAVAERSAAPAK